MRINLKDRQQVAHYWANNVQSEGKAGNLFFEGEKIWSYGAHFCVARRLPGGMFAITTRGYSPSTERHISIVRQACPSGRIVYCNDPDESAAVNMGKARAAINGAIAESETTRRIQQKTRDGHKARALRLAEQANAYLAALPENERGDVLPIDTTDLESIRAHFVRIEQEQEARKLERERIALHAAETNIKIWRSGGPGYDLWNLPAMLRLWTTTLANMEPATVVQTSKGAEIPVEDARKLWPMIQRVMSGERDYTPGEALGVYRLTRINRDGSIVVGCHNIAFAEIEGIAKQLGLI
jgi:hypothetical protein